jgi:hypothetical protein
MIWYGGKRQTYHARCAPSYSGTPNLPAAPPSTDTGENLPTRPVEIQRPDDASRFVIDWNDLQNAALDHLDGKQVTSPRNYIAANAAMDIEPSWNGYSRAQAKDWLENGYEIPGLDLEDFAPPIREKRRYIMAEEGDEIDLSAAWSGEDNFMAQWTKRETIPGISLEFQIGFRGSTSAAIVNAYVRWIAQACFAIESAGIDAEISIDYYAQTSYRNSSDYMQHRLIRVKRENEATDLRSWSAMLSPAAFRTFAFLAAVLAGDSLGKTVSSSIGYSMGDKWDCRFDADTGKIVTECPCRPISFPEEEMTNKLKAAIEHLKQNY